MTAIYMDAVISSIFFNVISTKKYVKSVPEKKDTIKVGKNLKFLDSFWQQNMKESAQMVQKLSQSTERVMTDGISDDHSA